MTEPVQLVDIGWNDALTEVSLSDGLQSGRLFVIYENPLLERASPSAA